MNKTETAHLARALDEVADRERLAILDGDFDALADITLRKAALIERLDGAASPDMKPLTTLHAKLARNQELLNSAMQGLRSVQARLVALREARDGLRTYDASGQRHRYPEVPGNTVERRA